MQTLHMKYRVHPFRRHAFHPRTSGPNSCTLRANVSRMRRALSPIHRPDMSFSMSILPGVGWGGVRAFVR
jgi:hypothetical protein